MPHRKILDIPRLTYLDIPSVQHTSWTSKARNYMHVHLFPYSQSQLEFFIHMCVLQIKLKSYFINNINLFIKLEISKSCFTAILKCEIQIVASEVEPQ